MRYRADGIPTVGVLGSMAVTLGVLAGGGYPVDAATYTVGMAKLRVTNAMETAVLTNSDGMSLYYFSGDTPTQSYCTGACAKTWRPLISDAPTKDPAIRGKVSPRRSDGVWEGRQVVCRHPFACPLVIVVGLADRVRVLMSTAVGHSG